MPRLSDPTERKITLQANKKQLCESCLFDLISSFERKSNIKKWGMVFSFLKKTLLLFKMRFFLNGQTKMRLVKVISEIFIKNKRIDFFTRKKY